MPTSSCCRAPSSAPAWTASAPTSLASWSRSTTAFGRTVVPVQLPIGSEKSFTGVVDLVKMQAYTYEMGGNGKAKVGPIPANMAEEAKAAHERLVELVAEGDDALMEEFFENGTIDEEHIIAGLHNAIREDKIFPVLFASGLGNMGTDEVLDFIVDYMPTAAERGTVNAAATANNGEPAVRKISDSEPLSLFVFKTISDPFAGRISFFKVFSGVLKNDATVQNFTRSSSEKFAHLSVDAGQDGGSGQRTARRRHRRGGQAERHADRRHAGRQGRAHPVSAGDLCRAGHHLRHRAQDARRRRQAEQRHPQADGRRCHAALLPRSADQGIPDRGHRPAAHRGRRLQAEEPLPHRGQPEGAEGSLSRDHPRQGRRAGPPQEAVGRPRPVRRLQDQDGASAARRATSSSSTRSSAARFPRTSFPPSKRASSKRPRAASLPVSRSSTSA